MGNPETGCRCGSGCHPRKCDVHPGAYERHIDELNALNTEDICDERDRYEAALTSISHTLNLPGRLTLRWMCRGR